MLRRFAAGAQDRTEDPRFGRIGRQKGEDAGPLAKQGMETIDDPFRTPVATEQAGISGQDPSDDGLVERDMHVGGQLKMLDEPGIVAPNQGLAARFFTTLEACRPSQSPGSFELSPIEGHLRQLGSGH